MGNECEVAGKEVDGIEKGREPVSCPVWRQRALLGLAARWLSSQNKRASAAGFSIAWSAPTSPLQGSVPQSCLSREQLCDEPIA